MDAWLTNARDAAARAAGREPSELDLPPDDARLLLEVARIAAHDSGDRRNAPLLCYLLGRAHGDVPLGDLVSAVRRASA